MAERGKGTVTPQGYVRLYIDGKKVGAHRKIMSQIIGRPLLREEEVHHINGIRGDNRPENLELWTTSQPKGKRVKDLLIWAKELIKKYENTESIKN